MAALGGLIAGIAHEINTPVGVGVTAASLLDDKTESFYSLFKSNRMTKTDLQKFVEVSRDSSRMILANLNRASNLIQSFKLVAVDQSTEEKRVFNVKNYIEEILNSLSPRLEETKHEIIVICPEPVELKSYPGALAQIITNLVFNSLIHGYDSDDEGRITIKVTRNNEHISLMYSDDGKGIAKDIQERIFEPFFTTKRGQGGSGLGLHLVYNLVTQKCKGSINCESQDNAGTTFHIKLPITD